MFLFLFAFQMTLNLLGVQKLFQLILLILYSFPFEHILEFSLQNWLIIVSSDVQSFSFFRKTWHLLLFWAICSDKKSFCRSFHWRIFAFGISIIKKGLKRFSINPQSWIFLVYKSMPWLVGITIKLFELLTLFQHFMKFRLFFCLSCPV